MRVRVLGCISVPQLSDVAIIECRDLVDGPEGFVIVEATRTIGHRKRQGGNGFFRAG